MHLKNGKIHPVYDSPTDKLGKNKMEQIFPVYSTTDM